MPRWVKEQLERLDRVQQRRTWLGFPVAVVKKFGEDRAGNLAALIAYFGFFSIFPLLLVFVSILGFALEGNRELQQDVLDSSLANFPVIGDQIRRNLGSLEGSGVGLGVGLATATWAGLRVVRAMQQAMNRVWAVPRFERASYLLRTAKAALFLVVIGLGTLASTVLTTVAASVDSGWASRVVGWLSAFLLSLLVFVVAFRLLTSADISARDVLPGAGFAAVIWVGLQTLGTVIVEQRIANASSTYGTFALVIALLAWLYLGAQLTVLAAEVNVVRARRLWPRSLRGSPTDADQRVFRSYAEMERRRAAQEVSSRLGEEPSPTSSPA